MKQYLVKGIHGNYSVVAHHSGFDMDRLIEIPDGAVKATLVNDVVVFWDESLTKSYITSWVERKMPFEMFVKLNIAKVIWEKSKMKEYLNTKTFEVIKSNTPPVFGNWRGIPKWGNYYYDYRVSGVQAFTKNPSRAVLLWQRENNLERKVQTKAEGFISGKDALIALANGEEVLAFDTRDSFQSLGWFNAFGLETNLFLGDTFYKFKLKPQTIEVNLKLPATFVPKEGDYFFYIDCEEECGYSCMRFKEGYPSYDENKIQFGAWETSEEIKQVVEAYRGVKSVKNTKS